MEEIYEWVPGYEGAYKVSNMGDVISVRSGKPKQLYQTKNNCGYMQVKLCRDNTCKHMYVHRLVALVFVPGYCDGMEVNHKDADRCNNAYTNLEWVTKAINLHYRNLRRQEERKINQCPVCGKNISAQAKHCREHRDYVIKTERWPTLSELSDDLMHLNYCEIGRKYGYTDNNIRKICKAYNLPVNTAELIQFRNGPVA